jgi:hypothetical protein
MQALVRGRVDSSGVSLYLDLEVRDDRAPPVSSE